MDDSRMLNVGWMETKCFQIIIVFVKICWPMGGLVAKACHSGRWTLDELVIPERHKLVNNMEI